MHCHCGSNRFAPLGIQKNFTSPKEGKPGKELYLINCVECGTTLSCSKTFYAVVEYLAAHDITTSLGKVVNLAH